MYFTRQFHYYMTIGGKSRYKSIAFMAETQSQSPKKPNKSKRFPTRSSMMMYFLRGSKRYFFLSLIAAMLLSLFELINPKVIGFTVDSIIGDKAVILPEIIATSFEAMGGTQYLRSHLWVIAVFVVAVALVDALWRILYRVNTTKGAETLVKTIRDDLYKHIIRLPFAWHAENATGDIIQRCTSDVNTLKMFLSEQLVTLFRMVVLITLAITFMLKINPTLTLVSLAFIPVIMVTSVRFHKNTSVKFENVDQQEGRLSAIAQENLSGVRVVRAFGREAYEKERFEAQNEVYASADLELSKLFVSFWSLGSFLSRFQIFVIIVIGVYFCVNGSLTSGQFIEFVAYNQMVSWPVRMLGRIVSQMSKAGVSIDRLKYIMNSEEEKDLPGSVRVPMDKDIVFDHVSFGYQDGTKALDDISFTIGAGTTVGILGSTGSGKSTMMHLLERLYDLDGKGKITIGGVDLGTIERGYVRENIGMVLQEPYLFSKTLAENIAIAKPVVNLKEVRSAARVAAVDSAIETFTAGYDTKVGERGVTLSGGQKQRTAIAQTLIRKTPVLIFDDSLSAVDTETDEKIRKALREETSGATVILIAHRITTLMHADNIIVLDHGKIVEQGTHAQLLAHNGYYKKIYDLQLQKDNP